ncbi:tetratricopeptide repeat protein [Salinicoccus roseus]|uniref:tetratricopeptide repeat protein n=1 Tax=Salinicoccus roseus TaxID=45670 RepID=UPI003DA05ABF
MFNFFKKKKTESKPELKEQNQKNVEIPSNPLDRNLQGKKFEETGEIEKAIELYEKNIEEEFEGNHPYDRLAIIYRKRKQYREEIRVLNQAVSVFEKEKIKSKRQDVNPKLIRFKERLEKVKALEEKN